MKKDDLYLIIPASEFPYEFSLKMNKSWYWKPISHVMRLICKGYVSLNRFALKHANPKHISVLHQKVMVVDIADTDINTLSQQGEKE